MFYHKGLKPRTSREEFDFLFVSIVPMVGLSTPSCWGWRQKGRPGSIWGVWGSSRRGEYCRLGGGRMGQEWVEEQDSRVRRGMGRASGSEGGAWGGHGRWPLAAGALAQPLPLTQGGVTAPGSFPAYCVPFFLERPAG